jgi:AcrR family transcriptional regulator
METSTALMGHLRRLYRRLRQQERIDELTRVQRQLLTSVRQQAAINALEPAVWEWLQARIAYNAARGHDAAVAAEDRAIAATAALDHAARAALMSSGARGSWGRGVPRDWECSFDPEKGGCECAGCGYTEATCRSCHYRAPFGEKSSAR